MVGFEPVPVEVRRGAVAVIAVPDWQRPGRRAIDARIEEARGLAEAIGLSVADGIGLRIRDAKPATLFGSGQVTELAARIQAHEAELLIVDGALTPVQQRNLEVRTGVKVVDRTGLILEIFGERAASAEGRLQVELAHLDYQAGRLVRSWTHLERQRGGFGFLGGPGETQIEADRRLIRDRMAKLRRELGQVVRTRGLHRDRRQRAPWPVVALVGYTNAGKSTLFNRLTGGTVFAENLLFATLDPTMREMSLPGMDKVILSDTVGFVSDLPTQLIAAFKATLEEVRSADLIIHVRDVAHPDSDAQAADVADVLKDMGMLGDGGAPVIEALNKIDILTEERRSELLSAMERETAVAISAATGEGVDNLRAIIAAELSKNTRVQRFDLDANDGAALAWLHAHGRVEHVETHADSLVVSVRLSDLDRARFAARSA